MFWHPAVYQMMETYNFILNNNKYSYYSVIIWIKCCYRTDKACVKVVNY